MKIKEIADVLENGLEKESQARAEIVAKSPDGQIWQVNYLKWCEEAEEWQVFIAPI